MTNPSVPSPSSFPHEIRAASLATDRYQVVRELGSGGMATVYEVLDRSTQRRLALKRLQAVSDVKRQRRLLELFEHEFYTLSQIVHPCVVAAYDYGVDHQGAYYTMELLEGVELQRAAPMPAREACRLGRDLCSALSLLHSRRLVFRDLNPRNVYVSPDGGAKLIDFGAATTMGPASQVVGTPAYCAPEAIDLQPLDARTDLYSVGATLYFALTGQHAYPAHKFSQLRQFWDATPALPSALAANIPPALDALVMELLHLDPTLRPANAAEVMEQLAAIEGRPVDEQSQVTQAYLSTPNLVGRDPLLARVRAKLLRALRGYGSALIFGGASGVGRTRLLAACLLEAKLLGALALRADASDADEQFGVVRALAIGLIEAAPELAQRSAAGKHALLVHALPELASADNPLEPQRFDDRNRERAQVLAALRDFFLAAARERPIMLAVDDLHHIDEPSAACLALCAHEVNSCPLLLAAASETGTQPLAAAAFKLFEANATTLQLANLSAKHSEDLLHSVFGEVPHVQLVARTLFELAKGNPRDTLQLAQSLVDDGRARYRAGAWSLPAGFDAAELPASMAQAFDAQVERRSDRARELGCVLSLLGDRGITFDECVTLAPEFTPLQVNDALVELAAAQITRRSGEQYGLAHPGFEASLRQVLDDSERMRMHLRIAELFARRGGEEFRRAMHLMRGAEPAIALEVLAAWALEVQALAGTQPREYLKFVQSMPSDWLAFYTHAIETGEQLRLPVAKLFLLRNRLAVLTNVMGAPSSVARGNLRELVRILERDSGLLDYREVDPALEPGQRLKQALQIAKARHEQSAEAERGLEPTQAITFLSRFEIVASGMAAIALDYDIWASLPPLHPLVPLSPSVGAIEKLVEGVGARLSGHYDRACAAYREVLERIGTPGRAGLDATNHSFMYSGVSGALGVMEANMGLESSLKYADAVEEEPLYRVSALQIRMLHQLWQGRAREADQLKERIELLRIETSPRQLGDGTHFIGQVTAHAYSDDLTRLKHGLDEIRLFADRHPGWARVHEYASGEYQRVRGDYAAAAVQLQSVLAQLAVGRHQIWPHAAGAYTRVLGLLGRTSEAIAFASDALRDAEAAALGYLTDYIRMPFAIALAEAGDVDRATELADHAVRNFENSGSQGLNLVLAYETRARVAIHAKDTAAYEDFAGRCADQCRNSGSRALNAKYQRLTRSASTAELQVSGRLPSHVLATMTGSQLTSVLVGCHEPSERAERSLQLLLRQSGASEGYLYLMGDHGPELVAQAATSDAPDALAGTIHEFIHAELEDLGMTTRSEDSPDAVSLAPPATSNERLVLLSHQTPEGFAVTGAAALRVKPGANYQHPGTLAAHLSRLTFDAGDVTPILAE